ncbi:hypothetical protein [Streptomyces sp. RB17]|uniref:hypothetical protein n=1 Tax=Streptomyces sp. RB17 TaxID=2585197 RepID=UPI003A4C78EF
MGYRGGLPCPEPSGAARSASESSRKGHELSKTQVIPITDEELSNLPLPTAKAIEIAAFVPQESVSKVKAARGEDTGPAEVHELPQPRKKTAAKKQPAKKATAKKTTAKKTTGRRPRSA